MKYNVHGVELDETALRILIKLDAQCFPYDARMSYGGTRWWLAETDRGEPVGYAGLEHTYGDRGFLCRVGVLPAHRGQGLQRRLVRARERGARALDMARLISYTAKENVVSSNNLIKCGYQLYRPEYEWGSTNALYWTKDI